VTVPVFDGHNDALTREPYHSLAGRRPDGHVDLPRMAAGGMRGGIFAVFAPSERQTDGFGEPVERTDGVVEFALAPEVEQPAAAGYATRAAGRLLALERAGVLRVARSAADLDAAHAGGPPAAVLHLEGAEAIDPGLEALDAWHAAGLRSLGLVWSRPNRFGNGVPFRFPSSPDTGPGLTDAGVALVRRCAELGIAVDLSHLNAAGFWDVARLDAGPLIASHSGAHALAPASRNLTDEQLDAIGSSGGLVGIVFACAFLRADFADDEDTEPALIAAHARHVADRIGAGHVALGSDFDGATIPRGVGDAAGLPRVLDALAGAGFTADEVAAIAWHNWRRVLAAAWG
jgi:membrane dipeptidase